jgi:hypothetical protein
VAGKRNYLSAGERAGSSEGLGSDSTTCVEQRTPLVGPTCRGQGVTFGRYHLGGALGLARQCYWIEPRPRPVIYYPKSQGSRHGVLEWVARLVRTYHFGLSEASSERTTGRGAFGLCRLDCSGTRGVWRLDLLLGDLGRYHSLPRRGRLRRLGVSGRPCLARPR